MKLALLFLMAATIYSGTYAQDAPTPSATTLPTLQSPPPPVPPPRPSAPRPAPAPAPRFAPRPAPGPGAPASCALQYLQSAGNFNTLISLVGAASESQLITQILGSSDVQATLLAPTDAGIDSTVKSLGLTLNAVIADPLKVTQILMYHLLPSNLQIADLQSGNSFNTELTTNGTPQSLTVNGSGQGATLVGKQSAAPIAGTAATTCQFTIIPLNGLLVP